MIKTLYSQYVYLQFTIVILRLNPSDQHFSFWTEIIDRHTLVGERLE